MISHREAELLARRATLRERSRQHRRELAIQAAPLAAACTRLDQARRGLQRFTQTTTDWAQRHPLLVVAGFAALLALRPRRVLRWAGRLYALWRGYRRVTGLWRTAA